MNKVIQERICARLKGRIAAGISQNKLAEELGLSPAHLSNVLGGQPGKVSEEVWVQLWQATGMTIPVIETQNLLAITELMEEAQTARRMVACAAETGYGKTTALKGYCKGREDAYYLLASPTTNRLELVRQIADLVGCGHGMSINDTIVKITHRLNSQPGCLLVIDDAGKLGSKVWPIIQEIRDRTETMERSHTCGIVLAGTPYLRKYLNQGVRAGWNGFPEVYSRIGFWLELRGPSAEDVEQLCSYATITSAGAVKYVRRFATNYRLLSELLASAVMALRKGLDPNRVEVLQAIKVGDAHLY
jgi:DNA transposition AAA+ family ATPase